MSAPQPQSSPAQAGSNTGTGAAATNDRRQQPGQRGAPRPKGVYGRMACDFCRKRKIKCDGTAPCSACVRFRRPQSCIVTEQTKRARPTQQDLAEARQQIRSLQAQIPTSGDDGGSRGHQQETGHSRNDARSSVRPSSDVRTPTSIPSRNGSTAVTPRSPLPQSAQTAGSGYGHGEEARQVRYHGPTSASFHDLHHDDEPIDASPSRFGRASGASLHGPSPHGPPSHLDRTPGRVDGVRSHAAVARTTARSTPSEPVTLPSDEDLSPIVTAHAAFQQQAEMANVVGGRLDFDGLDPELVMHLLSLHWNRQHHAFLVTYRPLFMRDMAAGSSGRYFSKLLLHAILFGAAKFSDRVDQLRADPDDPSSAGAVFQRRLEVLLPEALMTSRITTVQALLLLASTHFARGAESAAWLHSGLAFRMASDLGLFVSDGKEQVAKEQMAPEEMEVRRRVAWAAYTIDKIHSLYQGRQVSIRAVDMGVPAAFIDLFEEQEYWTPIAYQSRTKASMFGCPVYSVSTFTQLCQLTMILERIIEAFYGVKSAQNSRDYLLTELTRLQEHMRDWVRGLPAHLRMDFGTSPPSSTVAVTPSHRQAGRNSLGSTSSTDAKSPNVLSLNALYHCLVIMVHRPFLPYGHLYDRIVDGRDTVQDDHVGLNPIARAAWKACVDAAWQISHLMSLYRRSVTMKGAPQLISYINFCAAGIHVRLAAQVGPHSDLAQRQTSQAALRAVRACLEDFEENEHPNPGVAKATSVIRRMARHFAINPDQVDDHTTPLQGADGMQDGALLDATPQARRSNYGPTMADRTASTPSRAAYLHGQANPSTTSFPALLSTDQFDLDAFLSTFDDLNNLDNLLDPSQGGHVGADVMFGFLKDT